MASSKTIALKIALNGEREFRAAMQAVKKETNLLRTELKQLDDKYKDNRNSMEALEARQKTLSEAQEAYTKRVKAASDGLENAKKNEQDQAKRLEELRDQLDEARKAMEAMEKAGDTTSEAYQEQKKKVEELSQAVKDQTVIQAKAEGAVSDWRKELSTAQHNLDECNEEIQKNDKYLEEAKQSADGCATSIDKYGDEVGEAAKESDKLSVSLGDMVKNKVVDILGDALVELGRKAIEAAKYCIEVGSSFEAQMDKVAAISGATGDDLDKLTKKAQEMGATTKFSATESAEALEYMAMAGWKTNDMVDGLDGIMNLAAASGEDLATTSDIVTDALTAFGQTAKESGRLADIMAAASSNANTNVSMMGETFKYAAPVAGALGYSMEDTALAIGLMANAGIKASQAGTSIRSGLTRLATPTKQVTEAMDKYGISLTDADGKMLSFRELMEQLREKLGGLSEVEQTAAVSALFGKNAMSGWLAVVNGSGQDFDKLASAIDNSNGSAAAMAETMQDNLAGKLTIMNSALEGLGIAVYNYVSGPLQGVVEFVTGIISGITDLITPQKTELETFVDDITKANEEVKKSIERANETFSNTQAEVAQMEASKTILEGILDNAEAVNEIDLGNGKTAIINESGEIVSFGFAKIEEAASGAVEKIEEINEVNVDGSGIKSSIKTVVTYFDPITEKVTEVRGNVDELGKADIDTSGIIPGTEVVIEAFNGVGNSVGEAKGTIDAFGNVQLDTGATSSIGNIALAFDKLSDSASGTADTVYRVTDEFQKYQTSNIVTSLSNVIPQLTKAWDEQSGVLRVNKTDLEEWFKTAEAIAMKEALLERQTELVKAQTNAYIDQQIAISGMNAIMKQYNEQYGTAFNNIEDFVAETDIMYGGCGKLGIQMQQLQDDFEGAAENLDVANNGLDAFNGAVEETAKGLGLTAEEFMGLGQAQEDAKVSGEEAAAAANKVAEGEEDVGDAAEEAAEKIEKLTEKQQEAIDSLGNLYDATKEDLAGIQEVLGKSDSDFAEWAQNILDTNSDIEKSFLDLHDSLVKEMEAMTFDLSGEGSPLDNLEKNLQERNQKLQDWVTDMQELMAQLESGNLDQSVYDAIVAMGPEKGGEAAAAFAEGFRNGNYEQIDRIQGEFATQMDLSQNAYMIASATTTGQAYANNLANRTVEDLYDLANATIAEAGVSAGQTASDSIAQGITNEAPMIAEAGVEAGQTAADSVAQGITNEAPMIEEAIDNSVTEATESATTEAENASTTGETMATSTKEGIESTKEEVRQATESMISEARETGEAIASEFHRVGQIIPQKVRQGIDEANGMGIGPASSIESMMQQALNAVDNMHSSFHNSGYNSAIGVANGIYAGSGEAINAAINLANEVNNAYNNALQIHSPSRVMKKSGVHTVEGVEAGFEEETPKAAQKAMETAEKVADAYNKGAEKARTDKLVEDLNLSVIHDSAEKISPLSSMTDSAMNVLSSANDRTQAAINRLAAEISRKLDDLAEALRVTVVAEFGTEQFDARAIRVVKKAISNDNQALKISRGR